MKYSQCIDCPPPDIKYYTQLNSTKQFKNKICYDWPPDYIEEPQLILENTQIDVKFKKTLLILCIIKKKLL